MGRKKAARRKRKAEAAMLEVAASSAARAELKRLKRTTNRMPFEYATNLPDSWGRLGDICLFGIGEVAVVKLILEYMGVFGQGLLKQCNRALWQDAPVLQSDCGESHFSEPELDIAMDRVSTSYYELLRKLARHDLFNDRECTSANVVSLLDMITANARGGANPLNYAIRAANWRDQRCRRIYATGNLYRLLMPRPGVSRVEKAMRAFDQHNASAKYDSVQLQHVGLTRWLHPKRTLYAPLTRTMKIAASIGGDILKIDLLSDYECLVGSTPDPPQNVDLLVRSLVVDQFAGHIKSVVPPSCFLLEVKGTPQRDVICPVAARTILNAMRRRALPSKVVYAIVGERPISALGDRWKMPVLPQKNTELHVWLREFFRRGLGGHQLQRYNEIHRDVPRVEAEVHNLRHELTGCWRRLRQANARHVDAVAHRSRHPPTTDECNDFIDLAAAVRTARKKVDKLEGKLSAREAVLGALRHERYNAKAKRDMTVKFYGKMNAARRKTLGYFRTTPTAPQSDHYGAEVHDSCMSLYCSHDAKKEPAYERNFNVGNVMSTGERSAQLVRGVHGEELVRAARAAA